MLQQLLQRWKQRSPESVVAYMSRIYGTCPHCGEVSIDHLVWQLASARPTDPQSRCNELEKAIAESDWSQASQIQEFRGDEDAIVFSFLRCPATNGITLLREESFAEL